MEERVLRKSTLSILIAAGLGLVAGGASAAGVTDQMIVNDAKSTGDVLSWGMGTQGQRYSPLSKINTSTVKNLVPAWSFSFGGEKQRGQEAQPVIHNGTMFVTGSYSRLYAIDTNAKDGYVQQWNFHIERSLTGSLVGKVGYVGTKSTALDIFRNPNTPRPGPGAPRRGRPSP
jgi:glucose dehydrogenase